jgi:TRAP-type C4-dicarboxylate transport system permease small subunit
MASYGVLEEHTTLDPDFSILALAFCWACGLSWNEAWANVKSSLLDIPMSLYALLASLVKKVITMSY